VPRARGQSGFTLVEVLVATAVLAIGLLAALTAFSIAIRVTGTATTDTAVSLLAQQKLAEIQALGAANLTPGTTSGAFDLPGRNCYWEMTVYQPDELRVVRVDLLIYSLTGSKRRDFRFTTAVF